MTTATDLAIEHVLKSLSLHRQSSNASQPLFVAIQGPQGSGKTHLTRELQAVLKAPPHSLHLAVLSLDDLYLPHEGLLKLASDHPDNRLWTGRGQPGTHDVPLGVNTVKRAMDINSAEDSAVELPVFDKSLFAGAGDRLPIGDPRNPRIVTPPNLDIFILEGWCVGFYPLHTEVLEERLASFAASKSTRSESDLFDANIVQPVDIHAVNDVLQQYVDLWAPFRCFIQIKPPHAYTQVYKWRLEAEHIMKARNGGNGMTDEQIKTFVDRYVPGYIFWLDTIETGGPGASASDHTPPPWKDNGLRIMIGEDREMIGSEAF